MRKPKIYRIHYGDIFEDTLTSYIYVVNGYRKGGFTALYGHRDEDGSFIQAGSITISYERMKRLIYYMTGNQYDVVRYIK